jgi:hypothetical protein
MISFLRHKDVRERFQEEFQKPRLTVKKPLLAPPLSKRYGLVGTAFDYLLRFQIKRLNKNAISYKWVAENVPDLLLSSVTAVFYEDTHTLEMSEPPREIKKVLQIIRQAKKVHSRYLVSGRLTKKVLETSLQLAQLDIISRSGFVDENLGYCHEEDLIDLRKLISIVNPMIFNAKKLCLLNPTFGKASKLVGGADADLVIDDMLIEIKTTKKIRLLKDTFHQLMGYYVLHRISGVGQLKPKARIRKVAIYFSRYSYLHVFNLNEIIRKVQFPDFIKWFKERASMPNPLEN